jgi:hypothetical protein
MGRKMKEGEQGKCGTCGYSGTNFSPSTPTKCRVCAASWQHEYRNSQTGRPAWLRTQRRHLMRKRYGIEPEEYEALRNAQGSCCAICGVAASDLLGTPRHRRLHIDHDHKTGLVRGLVCNGCNRALGYIGDNAQTALSMADYLKRHDMVIQERARREGAK